MKKNKLKNQTGFVATDVLIALLIITLFIGMVTTVIYNIYLSNSSIKRMAQATSFITDTFEYIDKIYYDQVTVADNTNPIDLISYFNTNFNSQDAFAKETNAEGTEQYTNARYKVNINIEKYNETEGNTDKLDLLKTVTVNVSYKLGNRDQTIEMSKLKKRENLTIPNKPEITLIQIDSQTNEKIVPIKYMDNKWQVTNENDDTWYNYENGYWAVALKTTADLQVGENVTSQVTSNENSNNIYVWIPRYAYKSSEPTDVKFMYSTSDKEVLINQNVYNILSNINTENYDITLFNDIVQNEQIKLKGRWITFNDMQQQTVPTYFNNFNTSIYQIKNLEI